MSVKDSENSHLLEPTPTAFESLEEEEVEQAEKKCFWPLIAIIVFLVLAVLFLIGVIVFLTSFSSDATSSHQISPPLLESLPKVETCRTNECITISHQLLNWRNPKVNPCENFYENACGRYLEHSATEGTRVVEKETIVMRLITEFIRKNDTSCSKSENTLRLLYNKCNEIREPGLSEAEEGRILREVLQNILKFGPWPMMNRNWNSSTFDLNEMLTRMARLHVFSFGLFEVVPVNNPHEGSFKKMVIRPVTPDLEVSLDELSKAVHEIFLANNVSHTKKELDREISVYLKFDAMLRKFYQHSAPSYLPLSRLKARVPSIDFERIIRELVNPASQNWPKLRDRLLVADFDLFFGNTNNLETIVRTTDPRVLANFLVFKYIEQSFFYFLPRRMMVDSSPCTEIVALMLPRAALRVFVRGYFNKENLKAAANMMDDIKKFFIKMIRSSAWLHETTKTAAIVKVREMEKLVGYTEEYEREGALDEMFATLPSLPSDSFYTLMTKINRFKTEQLMDYIVSDSLLNPIEPLVTANAFYYPLKNSINILVPFLDKPLFDSNFPRYVTLAGIGRVMAHEVGHAFDLLGRRTDEKGRLKGWWTRENAAEYEKRVKCLVGKYEESIDPDYEGRKLNGTQVLSEMIADALGSEVAWNIYKSLELGEELRLFGFEDYDLDKLYFYIAALDFCAPRSRRSYFRQLQMSHPTNRFRVNGVFSNMRSFAETFQCPVGSPMNPDTKCDLF
ncbi:unnamed protein product [Caenorhabditis sp. 36 PRJEB53466]|nr:unnamed protein product [Caenorhabditis sp. 36 PRJEB53466]